MANDPVAAYGPDVRVQVGGLTDLADQVRADNDAILRPRSSQVETTFAPGVLFGATSASGDVYAAKHAYRQAMVRTVEVLDAYVRAADALAAAARTVADRYRDVDALAAARADEVARALDDALNRVKAVDSESAVPL